MLQTLKNLLGWRWRVIDWWQRIWAQMRIPAARLWRPLMFRTTFIAVCGSAGKTTTKEILGSILGAKHRVTRTSGTWGGLKFGGVPSTILGVRPWHRFAIIEAAIETKGQMEQMANLIKPDMVIMLAVKECHIMEFRNLEGVAQEKSEMLKGLGASGVAILNGDDPMVAAMSGAGDFRVVEYGTDGQEISGRDMSSHWPGGLEFTLLNGDSSYPVKSRVVGTHWVGPILAALAAAKECGVLMDEALHSVEQFEPFWARLQPITLDNGVTFLRDEWNGSYDTLVEAIKVMVDARAGRKIAVVSEYSDSHRSSRSRVRAKRLARELVPAADIMIFVGERAGYSRDAAVQEGLAEENVFEAYDTREASDILKSIQRPGDLVLLKGKTSHHLSRVYLDQLAPVACNEQTCPRQYLCDRCKELGFDFEEKFRGLVAPPDVIV